MNSKKLKTAFEPGRGYSQEDWDAVADNPELTDEEIASLRPAREVLASEFFTAIEEMRNKGGRPKLERPKQSISIRLDQDVIEKFKAGGPGWQSRMNEALRAAKVA